jgi:spermidine synthase
LERIVRNLLLLTIAFLSGAVLMALEILGSRVLGPDFGGSIFVWGSLIGVFLAALSIGYYLGGWLVDRWPTPWLLGAALLVAGVIVRLLPHYMGAVNGWIVMRELGDRAGPLLACTALFFVPGALMGMTSPFVIRLTAHSVERMGKTAGAVYAVSTVGSIVGTLGAAFYLITWLGLRANLQLLGYLLMATGVLTALVRRPAKVAAPVAAVLACLFAMQPAVAAEKILLERDSPYHRLFVADTNSERFLRADNIWHTRMVKADPQGRGLPYTDYIDLAFLYKPNLRSVLVIGLGGGTVPKRFVRDYPQVSVEAVDIDPDVVKIAKQYFSVQEGPRLKISTQDGRQFLRRSTKKYDLILLDAYYADTVPFFLTTKEFFQIVRAHLTPGGVFVNNTLGQATGPNSKFFRSVYRSMKEVLPQCHAFKVVESGPLTYNLEIFAVNDSQYISIDTIRERAARNTLIKDVRLTKKVANYLPNVKYGDVPALTDDYAPVDALLHLW